MAKRALIPLMICLLSGLPFLEIWAQSAYEGMYASLDGSFVMEFLPTSDGSTKAQVMLTSDGIFRESPTAIMANGSLSGNVAINGTNYQWVGQWQQGQFAVVVNGYTYWMQKLDAAYAQQVRKLAEQYQQGNNTYQPQAQTPQNTPSGLDGLEGDYAKAAKVIAGAKITHYTSTSVLSGTSSSSLGEIHLCPSGHFFSGSEGSTYVEGYGGYGADPGPAAGGAYTARSSGTWTVADQNGQPCLVLQFKNGSRGVHYLSDVNRGSWKYGSTKYAIELGKANCR